MMLDVLKATFIGLYKQHFIQKPDVFKRKGLCQFIIRKTQVDYTNIINVLNEFYNYNFPIEEIDNKKSDLYETIHNYLNPVNDLINCKIVNIERAGGEIKGADIYWNDWKKYVKKYNIHA